LQKERAIRLRKLRELVQRLRRLQQRKKKLSRDDFLVALGQAKEQAGRVFDLLEIQCPEDPEVDAPWPVHGGAPWRGGRRDPQLSDDPAHSRLAAGHAEPIRIQALLRSPGRSLARGDLYGDYRTTNAWRAATEAPFAVVLTNLALGVQTFALRAVDDTGLAYRSAPFTAPVTSALRITMALENALPALEFPSVPGHRYRILGSSGLVVWETVEELTASVSTTRWPLGGLLPAFSMVFYRVRLTP